MELVPRSVLLQCEPHIFTVSHCLGRHKYFLLTSSLTKTDQKRQAARKYRFLTKVKGTHSTVESHQKLCVGRKGLAGMSVLLYGSMKELARDSRLSQ